MALDTAEAHEAFVKKLLKDDFGLQIESTEATGKAHNNFVYKVELSAPTQCDTHSSDAKPGVSPIPSGTTTLCMRLSRDGVCLEEAVRVPNEVAFTNLARAALAPYFPIRTVPLIFGWADKASGRGWILREWLAGETPTVDELNALGSEQKTFVFQQTATVVKALQDYELPATIARYGGLGYDAEGRYENTLMTLPCGGPFSTFEQLLKETCKRQMALSDTSDIVKGWRGDGIRERLEKFLAQGLDGVLAHVPEDRPTLVHGDLNAMNILLDPVTRQLTGLIDFDFAHIGAPISEFVLSFMSGFEYCLPGSADAAEAGIERDYMLKGFPEDTSDRSKPFDQALMQAGAKKPDAITGADVLSDVWWFSQDICQAFWFLPGVLARRTPEQVAEMRMWGVKNLDFYLSKWGY